MERKSYAEEMSEIISRILQMGNKSIRAVQLTQQALLEGNIHVAAEVRRLEKEIDLLYQDVDERCVAFMATQQPLARDLRFIVSTIKINAEIERVADYANNIAKRIQKKFSPEDYKIIEQLKPAVEAMSQEASEMLAEAMHCYENNDAERALQVHERDKTVNRLNKEMFRNLVAVTIVKEHSNELAMNFHTIVRYIERVADRAGNIAELVLYGVTGENYKERGKGR